MDENHLNVVDCGTSKRKNKPKFVWDNATFMEFIGACLTELRKGNRRGTYFSKVGWANLEKTMKEKTGKIFKKKQLKNKWDNMKKDWKLYDRLMKLETGINGTRSLIDASQEWWEEKIKVDKAFAKFRDTNLDIYETHCAPLFRDFVTVGDQTMTPLQFQNNTNLNDVQREENIGSKRDGDEINLDDDKSLFLGFVRSSSSKRKKYKDVANNRPTNSKTSDVSDASSTESTQTSPLNKPSPTISDCMNIVIAFPGFNEGSKKYLQALRVLIKKQNREAFMYPTTHEAMMEFLKLLLEE